VQTDLVRLGLLDSGADFSIKYLYEINLFGQTVYLTTTHVGLLVVSLVLVILAIIVNKKIAKSKPEDTPGMLVNAFEMAIDMLDNMVKGTMGINARRFRNWISTIFMFVLQ
jgi:F-type H+-transporting ATPase subunit a